MTELTAERFYDVEENVREYIEAHEGIDGGPLIEILKNHLEPNSSVLELGIGAGTDLDILSETFKATGSDNSQTFLDIYHEKNPDTDLLLLDAVTLETNRTFDCIYSNKVLHHLSTKDLKRSLARQKNLLKENGILFHTFWLGDKRERFQDLNFIQYQMQELRDLVKKDFEVSDFGYYREMNLNDSIFLLLNPTEE